MFSVAIAKSFTIYVWTRENKRQDTCQIFGYAPKYKLGRGNKKSLGRAAL